jgi:hypothetical protein
VRARLLHIVLLEAIEEGTAEAAAREIREELASDFDEG